MALIAKAITEALRINTIAHRSNRFGKGLLKTPSRLHAPAAL